MDRMTPLLSIIIPVYNTEMYLRTCLESVISQSFQDYELLLIDDGSVDGSSALCNEFADKDSRIKVYRQDNGGVSSARNYGLRKARGYWITFIDSDDTIDSDYFPISFDDAVDFLITNWRFINNDISDCLGATRVSEDGLFSFLKDNIHRHWFRTACGSFFKRSLIEDHNIVFDSRFRLGEDTLFVLDYYKYCSSLQVLENAVYCYNRQENWDKKYSLSWDEAQSYLYAFMERYEHLPFESPLLLDFMFLFIRRSINDAEKFVDFKWSLSKPVLQYKKCCLSQKNLAYRFKYLIKKTMSFIIHV